MDTPIFCGVAAFVQTTLWPDQGQAASMRRACCYQFGRLACRNTLNSRFPMSTIESRLAELGVTLPDAPAPAANYVPFVQVGDLVHVSGQISQNSNGLIKGRLGADMDVAAGAEAAKSCAISLLAQLKKACDGDLGRVVRAVKLVGFVNSTADFTDQPKVINGASDFMVAALGDAGRHARSAVSAASLPLGVAVEIEGIFQIRPARSREDAPSR